MLARVRGPGQASKQNSKKYFFGNFLSAETVGINKIAMKSFAKDLSFGVDFKPYVSPLCIKINTQNISGVRNYLNLLFFKAIPGPALP